MWLWLFSTRSPIEHLRRYVAARKFEATLKPRLDAEVEQFMAEQERIDPAPQPVIIEHPINDNEQKGASRDLGGPISIHAPWRRD